MRRATVDALAGGSTPQSCGAMSSMSPTSTPAMLSMRVNVPWYGWVVMIESPVYIHRASWGSLDGSGRYIDVWWSPYAWPSSCATVAVSLPRYPGLRSILPPYGSPGV